MFHHSYTLSKNHDIEIITDISKIDLLNKEALQFKQIFPLKCPKEKILLEEGHHRIRFCGEIYREQSSLILSWVTLYVIILCNDTKKYIFRESMPQTLTIKEISNDFAGSFKFDYNFNATEQEKLNFFIYIISDTSTLTPIILKKMNIIIQSPTNANYTYFHKYNSSLFKTPLLDRDWSGYEIYDDDLKQISKNINFRNVFGKSVYFKNQNSDESYFQILQNGYYKIELSSVLKITFKDMDKEDVHNFSYFVYIFVYLKLNSYRISIKKICTTLDFISNCNIMVNLVHERKFSRKDRLQFSFEIIPFTTIRKTYINSVSVLSSKTYRFINICSFQSSISEGLLRIDHIYSIAK